ncbi:DUF3500 domain-containing protein [Stieleria varia]|uniref:DUF3500 domain-containing protein n=1 Tax=Stieleria varia TaxID=2528005 RepID=A0A5C6B7E0_9BACT|nr:DUF3500 domain-containing protein [Stieleria varia]TWU07717.1 hypothetical protein Pla52n_02900 [Stieleria varia]
MRLVRISIPAICGLCLCLFALGLKTGDDPGERVAVYANSFLESLTEDQKKIAVMPYDSEQRVDWHFIPKKTRKGLVLREMNVAQRTAALRLVRSTLSEAGYDKASKIMLLEGVLRELEGKGRTWERDPEKYFVTIFGTPGDAEPWGLSFEGHHMSLNFSFRDGKIADSTPQFFAANPATIMNDVSGPLGKGTRVLKDEEQLAFDLINGLGKNEQKAAIIADEAPKELRFAGEAQVSVGEPEGVPYVEMDETNQRLLTQLIDTYINAVPEKLADERRQRIEEDGKAGIHFAWAGALKPGIGHYYRVRGKRFLIEFVNTQADAAGNPANHIHSVWRDVSGDFDLDNQ